MQTIELAALADLHTLNDLSGQCCELVFTKLTPGNVTKALISAYRHKLSALVEACQTYGGLIFKLLKNIHFSPPHLQVGAHLFSFGWGAPPPRLLSFSPPTCANGATPIKCLFFSSAADDTQNNR